MAGDIQEPLRLSFQADYFHSGSISFGRFETEELCWERRSSFSHNRYLEEVEKCSKPGSVTEKKAYFEAHFKRKALLNQNPLECHSGIDCQNRENGNLADMFQEDIEHPNKESHIASYDMTPSHSVCDQSQITEFGLDYSECLGPDIVEHMSDNFSSEVNIVPENLKIEEAYETGSGNSLSIGEHENEAMQILNGTDEAAASEKSHKSSKCLPSYPATEIRQCMNEPGSASKVKIGQRTKLVNSKLMAPQLSVVKAKKSVSSEGSKHLPTQVVNKECHTPSRSRKEKQIHDSIASSTMRLVPRTLKTLASQSCRTKLHENKSFNLANESTSKHTVNFWPSTSEKVASRAHQNANRHTEAVNSTKPIMKQNSSAFSFKSDERAQWRKEFNMKMEEKMLAKQTEAQKVKAKKQEKTEADIKQFRKSLNFKATPMPSFYTEAGHSFDRNKVVAGNYKIMKVHNKQSSPGVGSTRRSVSGETSQPSVVSSDSSANHLELAADAESKNVQVCKPASLQNHRVLDGKMANKGQKIEGKHKVGAERTTKGAMRKDIKGVSLHNSSRMGNLAVGVAS